MTAQLLAIASSVPSARTDEEPCSFGWSERACNLLGPEALEALGAALAAIADGVLMVVEHCPPAASLAVELDQSLAISAITRGLPLASIVRAGAD